MARSFHFTRPSFSLVNFSQFKRCSFLFSLLYPCKPQFDWFALFRYHPMGCKVSATLTLKAEHELKCEYMHLKCPFHGQCAFSGAFASVVPHLKASASNPGLMEIMVLTLDGSSEYDSHMSSEISSLISSCYLSILSVVLK